MARHAAPRLWISSRCSLRDPLLGTATSATQRYSVVPDKPDCFMREVGAALRTAHSIGGALRLQHDHSLQRRFSVIYSGLTASIRAA